jgi:hypothetical protein
MEFAPMGQPYQHIDVERDGDIFCVSMRNHQPDDAAIRAMSDEVETLIADDGCRKLVFRVGPLNCLYSVLIARLIKMRRSIAERDGRLKLCEVPLAIMGVFESCQLQDFFEFAPDVAAAKASLKKA